MNGPLWAVWSKEDNGCADCVITSQKLFFYLIASMQLLPPAQYETLHKFLLFIILKQTFWEANLIHGVTCVASVNRITEDGGVGRTITLPFKMFGPFWSVWCKMAQAEVGVSLPWWCLALVLLAPGYWRLFLNLIIFS